MRVQRKSAENFDTLNIRYIRKRRYNRDFYGHMMEISASENVVANTDKKKYTKLS